MHQHAGIGIGTVGKDLTRHRQAGSLRGAVQFGQHRCQQDQVTVEGVHRTHDRPGQISVLTGLIAECAVRLHMGQPAPLGRRNACQRTDLIKNHRLQLGRRQLHRTPAKALQVGIGRMRAQSHTGSKRGVHRLPHHQRIASMKAARNVG
ncbi:hypothetical protein SDC9_199684 [bioreactor metagenome]|uniref:Uncharacterized protein n=1 Tax=bioreactor metagenome TaxID=1076179 RepID=A0A645IMF6_9ZZZZ